MGRAASETMLSSGLAVNDLWAIDAVATRLVSAPRAGDGMTIEETVTFGPLAGAAQAGEQLSQEQ